MSNWMWRRRPGRVRRMRALCFAVLAIMVSGCSCGGCAHKPAEMPIAQAPTVVDSGPPPSIAEVADAGELPWESKEGSPPDEQIVATYLADCRADIHVTFEDMEGPKEKVDCEALAFAQNCAPDNFGCSVLVDECTGACGRPCQTCQGRCAGACEGCMTGCDGGDCRLACATQRADCRKTCLYEVQRCRSVDCNAKFKQCSEDAEKRTKERAAAEKKHEREIDDELKALKKKVGKSP